MQWWQERRHAAVGEEEMEEKEGRGRKASTKVMVVLVEGELKEGETSSSIKTNRVIGVSHWWGVILVGKGHLNLEIMSSNASLRTCAKGRASSLEGLLAMAEGGLDCGKPLAVPSSTSYPLPIPPTLTSGGHKHPERILVFP